MKLLTVAIAVYRDFDGLYFTAQGLRANHREVEFDIVVLDNAPERCVRSEAVTRAAGGRYYHRPDMHGTSRSRDLAIRLAETPWVLCCDSHVLFESSAIKYLEDYLASAPENLIVSGPMVTDGGGVGGTHWKRAHPNALWGTWAVDARGFDRYGSPFAIDMNGLGAFAVNRSFWPGFNPLNRGFGGEEGIIHETYRRMGGNAICLPALRWRHRFRDVGGWDLNPVPYPLNGEDHVWNLLVGHRECGIDCIEDIRKDFPGHTAPHRLQELHAKAMTEQPLGHRSPSPRKLRVLGVWYSNNTAPAPLLKASLDSIEVARRMAESLGVPVEIATCSWDEVVGNTHPWARHSGERKSGHATIISQVRQCIALAASAPDVVCFMEHDVLYPEDYFERVEKAFRESQSPVVSNLDYIGLSANGWQSVKERHEPMHQLSMAYDYALKNLDRAEADCKQQGWAYLEPDHDANRNHWFRIPFTPGLGVMPSVHVNHQSGRFTSHGEVCYAQATETRHKHWGEAARYWPGPIQQSAGCGSCAGQQVPQFSSIGEWIEAARTRAGDFHEHVDTLRSYAEKCVNVAELVKWGKPSLVALAAGVPHGKVWSLAPDQTSPLAQWPRMKALLADRFEYAYGAKAGEILRELTVDLLFVDTDHRAETVYRQLLENAPRVRKYLVVHCTEIFGVNGDDGGPGVLAGIRRFLHENRDWVAIRRDKNNNGLMVLSKCDEDKKKPPGAIRKALNFAKALAAHAAGGQRLADDATFEARVEECVMCPNRAGDVCGLCGCPIENKASWAEQSCPDKPPRWLPMA